MGAPPPRDQVSESQAAPAPGPGVCSRPRRRPGLHSWRQQGPRTWPEPSCATCGRPIPEALPLQPAHHPGWPSSLISSASSSPCDPLLLRPVVPDFIPMYAAPCCVRPFSQRDLSILIAFPSYGHVELGDGTPLMIASSVGLAFRDCRIILIFFFNS